MKYFFIAGERSGDLHGSNLIRELSSLDQRASFTGLGGDLMQEAGMDLIAHYQAYSLMGFVEVVFRFQTVKKHIALAKKSIRMHKPDALILIDFGGFNMRIAKFAKKEGIRVVYYIPPKVWAWNTKRAIKLRENVDQLLCILPFEKEFYKKFDWTVEYVGNPVNDAIRNYLSDHPATISELPDKKIIALLPGSRPQELSKITELFLEVAKDKPDMHFLVAGISSVDKNLYRPFENRSNMEVIMDRTYDVLRSSHAAIVTSGTATLETALLNIPQVVVYKANSLSYEIGKRLIKVDHISLVNLILNQPLLRELIQQEANANTIEEELESITSSVEVRRQIFKGYEQLRHLLGQESASYKAAQSIYSALT